MPGRGQNGGRLRARKAGKDMEGGPNEKSPGALVGHIPFSHGFSFSVILPPFNILAGIHSLRRMLCIYVLTLFKTQSLFMRMITNERLNSFREWLCAFSRDEVRVCRFKVQEDPRLEPFCEGFIDDTSLIPQESAAGTLSLQMPCL